MIEPEDLIKIELTDEVSVRRGAVLETSFEDQQYGVAFGDWYAIQNTGDDAIRSNPSNNFDVGHNPTGMKLCGGLTFWEARRVAMAMDDAGLVVSMDASEMDPDTSRIMESIVSSALMDHYVWPICNYKAPE